MTLWTYAQIVDEERISRGVADLERIELASLIALAMNDPKRFNASAKQTRLRLSAPPPTEEDLFARAQELLSRARSQPVEYTIGAIPPLTG